MCYGVCGADRGTGIICQWVHGFADLEGREGKGGGGGRRDADLLRRLRRGDRVVQGQGVAGHQPMFAGSVCIVYVGVSRLG